MFYLVDRNNKVKAGYTDLESVATNGFRVVHIPSNVGIDPQDVTHNPPVFEYTDLIRQKYEGILANNPEFASIIFDDLTDDTIWDTSNSFSFGIGSGVYWVQGSSSGEAFLQTEEIALPGPTSRLKVLWDVYEVLIEVGVDFNTLYYQPVDPDVLKVEVSTSLANPFVAVFSDEPLTVTPGDVLRVRFESPLTNQRYFIGGWSILY
jgi:hypothetical protein